MKPTDQAQWQGVVESWLAQGSNTGGVIVNPGLWTIMADTGQLVQGWYDFTLVMAGTPTHFYYLIQHRDAANAVTLHTWYIPVLAALPSMLPVNNWYMVTNERMRILMGVAAVGSYSATVWWIKRA